MSMSQRSSRNAAMGPCLALLALVLPSCALHSQPSIEAMSPPSREETPTNISTAERQIKVAPSPALPMITRVNIEDSRDPVDLASFFSSDRVVRLSIRDASLEEVISVLRQTSERRISVDPGLERMVNASFRDLPLHEAMTALLADLGLSAYLDGQTLRIAEPGPVTVAFRLSLPDSATAWSGSEWGSLKKAVALALSEQGELRLTPVSRVLLIRDRPKNVDAAERILREILESLGEEEH